MQDINNKVYSISGGNGIVYSILCELKLLYKIALLFKVIS